MKQKSKRGQFPTAPFSCNRLTTNKQNTETQVKVMNFLTQINDKFFKIVTPILVVALLSLIPFYYQTIAAVDQNVQKIDKLEENHAKMDEEIDDISFVLGTMNERIKSNEKRLERIEKKIDYLIENK